MKTRIIIHIMLMTAVLLSCSKDKDATPKPEPVISMKVDGAEVKIMETTSQIVSGNVYSTMLQVDGTDDNGSKHITLFFASEAILVGEDIDLVTDNGSIFINYTTSDNSALVFGAGKGWSTESGHVMVQKIDSDKNIMEGTFSAELKELYSNVPPVIITEGKFKIKYQ